MVSNDACQCKTEQMCQINPGGFVPPGSAGGTQFSRDMHAHTTQPARTLSSGRNIKPRNTKFQQKVSSHLFPPPSTLVLCERGWVTGLSGNPRSQCACANRGACVRGRGRFDGLQSTNYFPGEPLPVAK